MLGFDAVQLADDLHQADDELAARLIADLSLSQADQVLLCYRDRHPGHDGDAVSWRLSAKACCRPR